MSLLQWDLRAFPSPDGFAVLIRQEGQAVRRTVSRCALWPEPALLRPSGQVATRPRAPRASELDDRAQVFGQRLAVATIDHVEVYEQSCSHMTPLASIGGCESGTSNLLTTRSTDLSHGSWKLVVIPAEC